MPATGVSCTPPEFCHARVCETAGGAVSLADWIGTRKVKRSASVPTIPLRKWIREGLSRSTLPPTRTTEAFGASYSRG